MRAVTIGAAARDITTSATQQERPRNKRNPKTNWGAGRLPNLLFLLCRSRALQNIARFSGRLAPRARCVQLLFSSKPGGFILVISGAR